MSYCRFSSDDWRSDVYCYAHVSGGFVTHVAARRRKGYVPRYWILPTAWYRDRAKSLIKRLRYAVASRFSDLTYRIQMRYVDIAPMRDIGLAHDGCDWRDANLHEVLSRLKRLKALGYRVPDSAFKAINLELQNDIKGPQTP